MIEPEWAKGLTNRIVLCASSINQLVDELNDKPDDQETVGDLIRVADLLMSQAGELRRALPHQFQPKDQT